MVALEEVFEDVVDERLLLVVGVGAVDDALVERLEVDV